MTDTPDQLQFFDTGPYETGPAADNDDAASLSAARLRIRARQLEPVLQQVLVAGFVGGASLGQVAERLGVDRQQVRNWERDALAQLGAPLADRQPEAA
jgi:DNA-directed RNA polymerase specialized sigma24 family protein